jgi:UDP-N-acetylmuramoylalanine--D-glutamate ligase
MQLKNLNNKKIALLGLGADNYAMLKFLFGKVKGAQFTVCDKRSKDVIGDKYKEFKNKVDWKFGNSFNKELYKFDILFRSPGWPLDCPGIREALARSRKKQNPPRPSLSKREGGGSSQTVLYSPIRLFFDLCPTKNIIGVTGTKGKGTTSSLINEIIKQAGKRVWLGGNIGIAPFAFIKKIKENDWVVLELSSFQLEDFEVSPRIAVINNFYSEHLAPADPNNPNYHRTLSDYWKAKFNIIKWQKTGNIAVLNRRLGGKVGRKHGNGQLVYFTKSASVSRLPGEHNKENIAAAETVARLINIKPAISTKAVAEFKGLEHRIELVREIKGVKYFDDSFATTPESAVIGIRSFKAPIVLLAGGADKGSDFRGLAKEIKRRVKFTVLFAGVATPRIEKALQRAGYPKKQIKVVNDIQSAVKLAREKIGETGTILMSPGCASFGMFKNYKERGRLFKEAVKKIK